MESEDGSIVFARCEAMMIIMGVDAVSRRMSKASPEVRKAGGERIGDYFYAPTVLTDVRPGCPAYAEEIFGPVASIIPVADEAAAIATANDTVYGLGASVFTQNRRRGRAVARPPLRDVRPRVPKRGHVVEVVLEPRRAEQRAAVMVRETLANYEAPPIDDATDDAKTARGPVATRQPAVRQCCGAAC